jgi:aminomethyltransferase
MANRTPLYQAHVDAGAKIVDFAGWDMPLHYGSQLQEHHAVRQSAGVFDVSHMAVVDIVGCDAQAFLQRLLANDVAHLAPGKALYSCMLNEKGGVLDDLIVYCEDSAKYRVVVNAAMRKQDIGWMKKHVGQMAVSVEERTDLSMLAVQGPQARELAIPLLPAEIQDAVSNLKVFYACRAGECFVGRTGYTGEDGLEIILPAAEVNALWTHLLAAGVKPIGLGARDTLRLEAGMCLYGSDMNAETTPYEAGLAWTVAWVPESREFIGRAALAEQHANGPQSILKGLVLSGKGVLRPHQKVLSANGETSGEITSGTFSPSLGVGIALAHLPIDVEGEVAVDIRGKAIPAKIVKPRFVFRGKACVEV